MRNGPLTVSSVPRTAATAKTSHTINIFSAIVVFVLFFLLGFTDRTDFSVDWHVFLLQSLLLLLLFYHLLEHLSRSLSANNWLGPQTGRPFLFVRRPRFIDRADGVSSCRPVTFRKKKQNRKRNEEQNQNKNKPSTEGSRASPIPSPSFLDETIRSLNNGRSRPMQRRLP